MADSHPVELDADPRALAAPGPAARGGWRHIFFDPDPEANARYAQADAELAAREPRLSRRARGWSVLSGILLSWLLLALIAWLALGPAPSPPGSPPLNQETSS